MEVAETILSADGKRRVQIYYDSDAQNPREEFDGAGQIVHWHSRYDFGGEAARCERIDPHNLTGTCPQCDGDGSSEEPGEDECYACPGCEGRGECDLDVQQWLRTERGAAVILPLALLDHSGLRMWIGSGPSPCDPGGWDSGQVGFIYATEAAVEENWAEPRKSRAKALKQAEKYLRGEVETYDQYLSGDVYGYVEERLTGEDEDEDDAWEETDKSCWGFYGMDQVREAAKEVLGIESAEGPKG